MEPEGSNHGELTPEKRRATQNAGRDDFDSFDFGATEPSAGSSKLADIPSQAEPPINNREPERKILSQWEIDALLASLTDKPPTLDNSNVDSDTPGDASLNSSTDQTDQNDWSKLPVADDSQPAQPSLDYKRTEPDNPNPGSATGELVSIDDGNTNTSADPRTPEPFLDPSKLTDIRSAGQEASETDELPSWDQLVAKAAVATNPTDSASKTTPGSLSYDPKTKLFRKQPGPQTESTRPAQVEPPTITSLPYWLKQKPSILLHGTPEPEKNKSKNEFSNADLAEKMSGAPGPNRPFTEPNIAEETTPPDQNPPTSDSTSTREEKPILGEEVIDMMQGSDGRWTTEPEKRPLGRKILRAVGNGVKAWAQNLDFRGKDKAWAIGMGVGVAESAAITFLMPAGPAKGLIKAGINALVLQGYYFGTNRIYGVHKSAVQRRYTGEGLTGRLAKIQENKESADEKMKNFFHGISAGAVYGSFGGLALSIGISAVTEMGVNLPEVKLPGIPKIGIPEIPKVNIPGVPHIEMPKIPDSEQVGQLIEGVKEKTTGISGEIHKGINEIKSLLGQPNTEIPADKAAEIANKVAKIEALQKVSDLVNSPDNPAAAAVGAHLNYTNDMVNQVLAAQHINPTSLSAQDYEALRLAVQHGLEAQSNNSFAAAAEEVASFDANNAGDVSHVLDRGKEIFENSLSDPTKQELFRHIAEQTLSAQQETHTAIIDHLIAAIPADHITSVDLGPGMTATQLLEDHGYTNVYDPVVLGEHVIVNYPLVDNMWGNMAQSYGWSEHFPISLPELDQLIAAAKNGDPEAILKLQKLQPATLRALHWLPVGGKFKILSPSNN